MNFKLVKENQSLEKVHSSRVVVLYIQSPGFFFFFFFCDGKCRAEPNAVSPNGGHVIT